MCRSTDPDEVYHQTQSNRLKIKAFYLQLSMPNTPPKPLPDTLTLHYLPRISGSPLEINETKIRPELDAFVTLHRVIAPSAPPLVYTSRERVRAGEAVRYEVFLREEKLLKGIFRKDDVEDWKMECECALEKGNSGVEISEAEISVVAEGHVAIIETVDMTRRKRGFKGLDEIPEEREEEMDSCDCCCEEMESESNAENNREEVELEIEGVRWAVDVGIWVVCLGVVGYLVSKASSKSLRKKFIL